MKQALVIILLLGSFVPAIVAQDQPLSDRPNNIYGGYGIISVYNFSNRHHNYDPYYHNEEVISSPGSFFVGYSRQLGKIVSIGMIFSYVPTTSKFSNLDPYYDTVYSVGTTDDHYLSGMTQVTITYVKKPLIQLYSAAALGITVDFSSSDEDGTVITDKTLKPAGQLTMFGLRVGKALGGFMEFGIGTNAIVLVGISYRFRDAK